MPHDSPRDRMVCNAAENHKASSGFCVANDMLKQDRNTFLVLFCSHHPKLLAAPPSYLLRDRCTNVMEDHL